MSTPLYASPQREGSTRGEEAATFMEHYCRIVKESLGGAVGETIRLRPYQRQLLDDLLREQPDGRLAHRQAMIGLPRKNGKSALLSGLALWATVLGPDGGEVYSVAGDREQARITFGTGRRMVELDPELSTMLNLYRDAIENPITGTLWRVVSSDAPLKEGLSPTFTLVDEGHVINEDLWNVFALAQGARVEPMLAMITTAGARVDANGRDTVAHRLYQHGQRVAAREIDDPSFFFRWWGAPADADHRDEAVWAAANPGYDDIVSADDFRSAIMRTPENEWRTKRLNQWVASVQAWLPNGAWEACAVEDQIRPGDRIVLALDGSFSNDSTALIGIRLTDGLIDVMGLWERPLDDEHWRVDIDAVEERIRQIARTHTVREITADPFRWARSLQILAGEGLPITEFPQHAARMTPATSAFYDAVTTKRLRHSGDPRLSRHIANAAIKTDRHGTRLTKDKGGRKIDLAVAAVFGLARANQIIADDERPRAAVDFITL